MLIIHVLRWIWKKFYSVAAPRAKQLFFFLLAKKFFRTSKNDFRASRC